MPCTFQQELQVAGQAPTDIYLDKHLAHLSPVPEKRESGIKVVLSKDSQLIVSRKLFEGLQHLEI